jgi:hypothetical protein
MLLAMLAWSKLGLEMTNTPAYYVTTLITDVKRFIVLFSLLGT